MAIEIAMPTTPNFMRSTFRLHRAVGQTISPFTGTQKTQEYDYVGWSADVTLPPMRRSVAVNWQSWLTRLKGSSNFFQFADPDALTNTGTYDTAYLEAVPRVTNTSTTLTFSAANSTIQDDGGAFANVLVGDYIFITGANDAENNGTHKVSAKADSSNITVTSTLADETNDSACTVKQNVKGATLVDLPNAQECCGFGGVMSVEHPELSAEWLKRKISNLEATQSPTLVVTDAGCLMHIMGGLKRQGKKQQVVHIAEVLNQQA